jgi:hypothetical protein
MEAGSSSETLIQATRSTHTFTLQIIAMLLTTYFSQTNVDIFHENPRFIKVVPTIIV